MNLTFKLQKPPELIFNYLTDMQRFASVHPVISKINQTGENKYLVYETLRFAFIPFSFTYPVSIEAQKDRRNVIIRATVMKVTEIEMRFELIDDVHGTLVHETIRFSSPLPVKYAMRGIFKKQHTQLFKNIDLDKR